MATTQRTGLRVRKLAGEDGPDAVFHTDHATGLPSARPFGGVVFTDDRGRPVDTPPAAIRVPHDYVTREPWVEMVGVSPVIRPAGPAANPMAKFHTFVYVDEFILHMAAGDYRYLVVAQPDKYDADGNPTDAAGDPTSEVRWYYDADLIGKVS